MYIHIYIYICIFILNSINTRTQTDRICGVGDGSRYCCDGVVSDRGCGGDDGWYDSHDELIRGS